MMLTQSLQITQSEEQKRTVQVIEEIEKYRETDKSNREVYDEVIRLQKEGKLPAGFQISEAAQEDKTELSKALSQLKMVNLGQEALQQTGLDTLRRAYARYEYYRQRSEQRTGTVIMPFNPYIVPGYPMFLFDDLSSGQHIVAYVTNVSHELTTESRNTTVSFINAQTLDEFVHEVFDARVGNTPFGPLPNLCAAPPNPLDTLRDVTQTLPRAEEYFRRLFHQNKEYSGVKSAAFDFTQAFEFVRSTPTGDVIKSFDDAMAELSGPAGKRKVEMDAAEKKLRADYQTEVNKILFSATVPPEAKSSFTESLLGELNKAIEKLHVDFAKNTPNLSSSVLETYTSIRPTEEFADFFKDPIKAYWFVSRPICTLDEYVDFRRRKGMKAANRSTIDSTHPTQGKGGKYYERILDLTPRMGESIGTPTFDENNNLETPPVEDLPDMRIDWTTRLITYRNKVILRQFWRSDGEKK
jgi:hypothetical protein